MSALSSPLIVAFDIETGGLSPERIREIAPEFREETVKVGNLGIEKAVEKINASKLEHYDKIEREAALNAEYGQALAIGWIEDDDHKILVGDEEQMLKDFWERIDEALVAGRLKEVWVGHNILNFDLPFLIRRSLILGVAYPMGVLEKDRYWADIFIDTMSLFAAGEFRKTISLDRFCKACGLPGKSGSGEHFATLLKEDEATALEYLRNDLEITLTLAEKIVPIARRSSWNLNPEVSA